MALLNQIKSPQDLKAVARTELVLLAQEIRETILSVISGKGGHLGASLGAVELTIALHYIFDAPRDRIVWDTGHQAYPHKLLTGRYEAFRTLREYGGISGFLSREESPYDTFGAGHAGTAISAALGMVEAQRHLTGKGRVIAVVGDGAITAGMAYEGLNHAGARSPDLIVILNDNTMSISRNVGALSAYLTRIITNPLYMRMKGEAESLLKHIPRIGEPMWKVAKRAEESVKGLIVPGHLFEEMGFRYIGPIDGHRIDHLLTTFEQVGTLKGPLLIHTITQKGKGYTPAEINPVGFHGISAFDLQTGISAKKKPSAPSYTDIFSKHLIHLAQNDRRIVAITAAMPEGTGLHRFAEAFPERSYDVGIAEQHAVTMAAGMATEGLRPVVAIYSTFLQRAYDQIIHDVALQNLPVIFCLDRAGLVGEDGPTHHGVFDMAYLKPIPNLVVMSPKDENELCQMLTTALSLSSPVAIRYPRGEGVGVPIDLEAANLKVGQGEWLKGDETGHADVGMIAVGRMVAPALEASNQLEAEGIKTAVVNARFIKPIDQELIRALARCCRLVVTLEEHVLSGGFGESVLASLQEPSRPAVLQIGLPDRFIEHGAPHILRHQYRLDAEGIVQSIHETLATLSPGRQG